MWYVYSTNEIPYTAIKKHLFSQMENKKVKQVLSGGWHQWEGGGLKERV
jgi:chitinase